MKKNMVIKYFLSAILVTVFSASLIAQSSAVAAPQGRGTRLPVVRTGDMAPDFIQYDPNGKPVRLSDFKGKYVLLDFWRSSCVPCRKQHPHLIKVYETYRNNNFTILSVSTDFAGDKDKWLAAMAKDKLTWPNVANFPAGKQSDDKFSPAAFKYGVSGIPRNFLIDPYGKVIAIDLQGPELDQKLAGLIK